MRILEGTSIFHSFFHAFSFAVVAEVAPLSSSQSSRVRFIVASAR
jgi:hypothetical protein